MITLTEHSTTDFQEFNASTAERIDKIERLIWEDVMGHDIVQTEDMKQQVEFLQYENNRLRIESVQQINTCEITNNTENFITV